MTGGAPIIGAGDLVHVRVGGDADRVATERLIARAGGRLWTDGDRAPGVLVADEWTPEHDPVVVAARASGTRITTLAGLIIASLPGPWVGVTGTAGKTSTCHALAYILRATGRRPVMSTTARSRNAWPDASVADRPGGAHDVVIAELTSTHLCHMDAPLHPAVAVVTTLRPDHADLHPTPPAYIASKRRLWATLRPAAAVVAPSDDPATTAAMAWRARPGVTMLTFGDRDDGEPGAFRIGRGRALIRSGEHVAEGDLPPTAPTAQRAALIGAAAAVAFGVAPQEVAAVLPDVPSVPHRLHMAGRFRDAMIIDDTMAATPLKGLSGIRSQASAAPVVVLGGEAMVHPDDELADALREVAALGLRVVAFGPAAPQVCSVLTPVAVAPTVMGAVATAATLAGPDGVVLVSPMFPMAPCERDRVLALPES